MSVLDQPQQKQLSLAETREPADWRLLIYASLMISQNESGR
jgi:hypothetical protein